MNKFETLDTKIDGVKTELKKNSENLGINIEHIVIAFDAKIDQLELRLTKWFIKVMLPYTAILISIIFTLFQFFH
ncbi:MAG: hypothetical protein EVG15_02160 [Candidatus Acididesulfobacter diazotrophicus]|uniref:DUF1640 domain-containing protein n=1 Tax=Candidatus Acididesulfobacter diazotrophicus TaxID=2597226 RepID=A0A519BPQ1_9DELT|nr:MAG: hypothetical protein EVG15_02160 [Candidatus Acididesulfobacter diazotrophicus]